MHVHMYVQYNSALEMTTPLLKNAAVASPYVVFLLFYSILTPIHL